MPSFLLTKFGQCSSCMRKAFVIGLGAWMVALASILFGAPSLITFGALAGAGILSVLWIVHLIAYSKRVVAWKHQRNTEASVLSRRGSMLLFARSLGLAVLLSASPFRAFADGACGAENCPPCGRPVYVDGRVDHCDICHSCVDQNGNPCGGQTC